MLPPESTPSLTSSSAIYFLYISASAFFCCFSFSFLCSSSSSSSASVFLLSSANYSLFNSSAASFSLFFLAMSSFSSISSSLLVFLFLTWFIRDLISERLASSPSSYLILSSVDFLIASASAVSFDFLVFSSAFLIASSSLELDPSYSVWTFESSSSESLLSESLLESLSCLWCFLWWWCFFLWCFFFSFLSFLSRGFSWAKLWTGAAGAAAFYSAGFAVVAGVVVGVAATGFTGAISNFLAYYSLTFFSSYQITIPSDCYNWTALDPSIYSLPKRRSNASVFEYFIIKIDNNLL